MSDKQENQFSLHKLKEESEKNHRAFLLWVMQNIKRRNVSAVGRAVGVSHTQIGNYRKQFKWDERATRPTDEIEAQQLYKRLYVPSKGMTEIQAVEHNILNPLGSEPSNVPRGVGESVTKAMKGAKIGASKNAKSLHEKEVKRRHIMLLDAAITYIAQGLKEGDIKRQLRDLPILISLRSELMDAEKGAARNSIVYESVRVKEAKDTGGDVVEAMFEDAKELQVILGALRNNNLNRSELFQEEQA